MALGLEWADLWRLRSATTSGQSRAWLRGSQNARRLRMAGMLTILISGAYMMATA